VTASALAAIRWAEDFHLFLLGTLAFTAAYLGRMARRKRWSNWVKLHITGMTHPRRPAIDAEGL
jgi:hypothetical protein